MPEPLKLKGRHALRGKDLTLINDGIEAAFGTRPVPEEAKGVEKARADPYELVLVDRQAFVVLSGLADTPVPTLRALLIKRPERRWVTVDMGAVPHVHNGADIMAPGITEAHEAVEQGDLVWVRDERNGVPLAVGEALMTGPEMAAADKGKAVRTLHHVGDLIWQVGHE